MNYLAHAYLSCDNELLLLGNLITDICRSKDIEQISNPDIIQGIHLHRAIDTFTDSHKMVKQSNQKFHLRHGKYAPVLTDIIYDYLLVDNWSSYSGEKLEDFTTEINAILLKNIELVPERIRSRFENMINKGFLMMSANKTNLQKSLEYMDRRTKFPSIFSKAIEDLELYYDELNVEFNKFFPELISEAESICNC